MREIPNKKSFKIGEVARLLDLEPYVLRYWETEFALLEPDKSRSGQRLYRRADIECLMRIQHLLHVEQYTIAGARRQIELHGLVEPAASQEAEVPASGALVERAEALEGQVLLLERALEQERELHGEATRVAEQQQEALRVRVDELIERLDGSIEQVDARDRRVAELEAELARSGRADEQWTEVNAQLGQDVSRLEQELAMMRQLKVELEQAHEGVTRRLDEVSTQRDQLQAHCAELTAQRTQLEAHCDELSARLRAQRQGRQRSLDVVRQELMLLHEHVTARA